MATIKRQLQLLLPSVSIFLDVDDLTDIGALEECIEKSAEVLMFLSQGCTKCGIEPKMALCSIWSLPSSCLLPTVNFDSRPDMADFGSRNCLREVVATIEKEIPYLFVHEANTEKGGAPISTLQLELKNRTHRDKLFDGRHAIVWHRVSEFQLISYAIRNRTQDHTV